MAAARLGVSMGPRAAPPPPRLPRTHRGLCQGVGAQDPHTVLGVRPGASPAEIRAAFLQRCKEVHPDGDPSDPTRHGRFLLLAEAYGALSHAHRPGHAPGSGHPHQSAHGPGSSHAHRAGHTHRTGHAPGSGHAPPRADSPPRAEPSSRYWSQFRPPGPPPGPPRRRLLLGLCLLLGTLGGVAHALAYRYVAGAHAAFLDERDRVLRGLYERARSRAGSREEVLRRLRASRQRGRGAGGGH